MLYQIDIGLLRKADDPHKGGYFVSNDLVSPIPVTKVYLLYYFYDAAQQLLNIAKIVIHD